MSYKKFKRFFDLVISLMGIVILSPILIILGVIIRCNMGAPVIFRQVRPGLNGKTFEMYKFRTMITAREGVDLSDEARITKFGRFLRASSLDELPELFNVIKGDMSLIGPRPLLVEYLNNYSQTQMRRHDVLPGITGLAQVKGRNQLTWSSKFRYDVFYVKHVSWSIDLMILLTTIKVVFFRLGFSAHGEAKKFGE